MKSIVFLAGIFLLVRASPPNTGARLLTDSFSQNMTRLIVLHALIIRPLPDYQFDTFDFSFMTGGDETLNKILSHPTFDLFPFLNDLHCSSETIEHECDPKCFSIIEKSNCELQAAGKYLWNGLDTDELEIDDAFLNLADDSVDSQNAQSEQHVEAGPSSQFDEEPNVMNGQGADMQEKGIVTACSR